MTGSACEIQSFIDPRLVYQTPLTFVRAGNGDRDGELRWSIIWSAVTYTFGPAHH